MTWLPHERPNVSLARDDRRSTRWYVLDGVGAALLDTTDPTAAWRCLCDHPRAASEVDEHGRVLAKANDVRKRLGDLQTSSPYPLQLLAVAPCGLKEESAFHDKHARSRIMRDREWFHLDAEVLTTIVSIRRAGAAS